MIDYGAIRSTVKPDAVEIDEYSVWLNSDIKEIEMQSEDKTHTEYEFNQVRYTKDEYIMKETQHSNHSLPTLSLHYAKYTKGLQRNDVNGKNLCGINP